MFNGGNGSRCNIKGIIFGLFFVESEGIYTCVEDVVFLILFVFKLIFLID